jgi:hypothetical protein
MNASRAGRRGRGRIIPLHKFEVALECCGSYTEYFNVLNKSDVGQEARELLMEILEPLLGIGIEYHMFLMAINDYQQSQRYKKGEIGQRENIQRFLEVVKEGRIQKQSKLQIPTEPLEMRIKREKKAKRSRVLSKEDIILLNVGKVN